MYRDGYRDEDADGDRDKNQQSLIYRFFSFLYSIVEYIQHGTVKDT